MFGGAERGPQMSSAVTGSPSPSRHGRTQPVSGSGYNEPSNPSGRTCAASSEPAAMAAVRPALRFRWRWPLRPPQQPSATSWHASASSRQPSGCHGQLPAAGCRAGRIPGTFGAHPTASTSMVNRSPKGCLSRLPGIVPVRAVLERPYNRRANPGHPGVTYRSSRFPVAGVGFVPVRSRTVAAHGGAPPVWTSTGDLRRTSDVGRSGAPAVRDLSPNGHGMVTDVRVCVSLTTQCAHASVSRRGP